VLESFNFLILDYDTLTEYWETVKFYLIF